MKIEFTITNNTVELLSNTDSGENTLIINGVVVPESSWTGSGYYSYGNINIKKIADTSGNIFCNKIDATHYELNRKTSASKGSPFYGTCPTAASTAAKVVTCADFTANDLIAGTVINVKFSNHNTVSPITLNINGTTAKTVARYGTTTGSMSEFTWISGQTVQFTFDGTYWVITGAPYRAASTSYYGVTKLSTSTSSTSTSLAATPSAVKAAYDLANSKALKTNIAKVEPSDTAIYRHEVGTYFINKDGDMCRTTSLITVGSTIVVNSNCVVRDVGTELNQINADLSYSEGNPLFYLDTTEYYYYDYSMNWTNAKIQDIYNKMNNYFGSNIRTGLVFLFNGTVWAGTYMYNPTGNGYLSISTHSYDAGHSNHIGLTNGTPFID